MAAKPLPLDAAAVSLSTLCLIHCLALPVLAAMLPVAGVVAEAEWLHRLFVLAAIPVTGLAIARSLAPGVRWGFILAALTGLALLTAAAFLEALHDVETPVTVLGASILAGAHIWRWSRPPH